MAMSIVASAGTRKGTASTVVGKNCEMALFISPCMQAGPSSGATTLRHWYVQNHGATNPMNGSFDDVYPSVNRRAGLFCEFGGPSNRET